MKRSRIVLVLWVIVAAGAIATGREMLYNLWYLLTALLIVSYLWAWAGIRWVEVERYTRTTRSQVGKMAEERLIIKNKGLVPKLWLEVRDHSTLPDHHVSRVVSPLGAKKTFARAVKTRCLQRGRFTLGPVTVISGDPFGLFTTTRRLAEPAPKPFIVYPATVEVPAFAPLAGYLPGGETMRRRTSFVTTDVGGVREYAPGDSFSRIHWRSTARTGRLMSKEFELDPTADIWLFLDLEESAQSEAHAVDMAWHQTRLPWEAGPSLPLAPSTVEYGVTIVASLAKHFLALDRAVGFITYSPGRELIPADRGQRQLAKILETLAVIRAEGRIPLTEIVTAEGAHLGRNTTAIMVTPTHQRYWVAAARDIIRRGVKVITVLIDPHGFGSPRSNEHLVPELAASGILTYMVREGDDLTQALATPYAQAIATIGQAGRQF